MILGSPLKRGNSDVIEAALYENVVASGAAASLAAAVAGSDQEVVKPFDGVSFAGFAVANDINTKAKTISVIKVGLNIPVQGVTGKTYVAGKGVFLNAAGLVLPEGDADAVYQVNGTVRKIDVNAYKGDGTLAEKALTIDLFGGGAPFSAV